MYRLSWNLGASTSWNPQGLPRPVMGLLYLLFNTITVFQNMTQFRLVSLYQSWEFCAALQAVCATVLEVTRGGRLCRTYRSCVVWKVSGSAIISSQVLVPCIWAAGRSLSPAAAGSCPGQWCWRSPSDWPWNCRSDRTAASCLRGEALAEKIYDNWWRRLGEICKTSSLQ